MSDKPKPRFIIKGSDDIVALMNFIKAKVEKSPITVAILSHSEEVTNAMRAFYYGAICRSVKQHLEDGGVIMSIEDVSDALKDKFFTETKKGFDSSSFVCHKSLSCNTKASRREACEFFDDCIKWMWEEKVPFQGQVEDEWRR